MLILNHQSHKQILMSLETLGVNKRQYLTFLLPTPHTWSYDLKLTLKRQQLGVSLSCCSDETFLIAILEAKLFFLSPLHSGLRAK